MQSCRISFAAIMHGETVLDISGEAEGDLSILKSEIYKMTVTLREQAEQLMAENRRWRIRCPTYRIN